MALPPASAAVPAEPTHPCIRCGRPTPLQDALCEECNPLGLKQPSATQVHGIAVLGLVAAVVILAVLARSAVNGVGPFHGQVKGVAAADGGLAVTLLVANDGTKAGATTCRVIEASGEVGGPGELVQTPPIQPGSDRLFTTTVTKFGTAPVDLAVDCQSP